jgi:serine/threonine protein kinase
VLGEIIKDFKITARLGRGGMGEVYAATHQLLQTSVAIKLLHEDISKDQTHVQRFFNEALAASKIKHAGIVKIFDAGFHERRAFMIMELLDGESLAARLRRSHPVPLDELIDLGAQLAGVLEATHAAGIIHRDLKPDNVFLVPDAELSRGVRVKVLDFGIAKLAPGAETDATALTTSNTSMGTPSYMAPELWSDAASADARTDVYALGCVLFEIGCGRPPFVAASIGEACNKHMHEVPPRVRTLAPALPAELDDLVARMLAKPAAERPSMRAINELFAVFRRLSVPRLDEALASTALSSTGTGISLTLPPAPTPASPPAPPRRTRTRLLAAGAATAIAAVLVGWRTLRTDEPAASSAPPPAKPPATPVAKTPPPPPPVPGVNCPEGMLPVPAGTFWMGSDTLDQDNARPLHEVTLSAFCMDRTEVTVAAYKQCADRGACAPAATTVLFVGWSDEKQQMMNRFCNGTRSERMNHPVNCVSWEDATKYCAANGKRLPTEAEWEYAARGTDGRLYPWGNEEPNATLLNSCGTECRELAKQHGMAWQAVYDGDDGHAQTAPVGSYPSGASPFGILDMGGNVTELVSDWFAPYQSGPATDPTGPSDGAGINQTGPSAATRRVARGSDWESAFLRHSQAVTRGAWAPAHRVPYLGFRCARAPL